LVFLSDNCLSGICPDTRRREIEQRWKVDDVRGEGNGIIESDVDLEINASSAKCNPEPNPDSFVFLVFSNWLSGHGFCMEAKAIVVIQLNLTHFAKGGSKSFRPGSA
jgi:hypothetical protein